MHEDHDVSRRARRKDTLSAEDLGILLQWHWKYGTSIFANERQRVQMGLLMLFSAFTGSRPATLLADNDSSCRDPGENSTDDLSSSTLAYDSDGGTLVDDKPDSQTRTTRPGEQSGVTRVGFPKEPGINHNPGLDGYSNQSIGFLKESVALVIDVLYNVNRQEHNE